MTTTVHMTSGDCLALRAAYPELRFTHDGLLDEWRSRPVQIEGDDILVSELLQTFCDAVRL